jgi:hypothetical protein
MYEDFDKFLEYLEPKVKADGSVGLANAIVEFWNIPANQATKEQVTGRLHATGKYLVQRGAETQSFLIRHNPDYQEPTERDKEISDLTYKKLDLDVKNAKRVYDTYWFTFWFALAALVISLFLAILKLAELAN